METIVSVRLWIEATALELRFHFVLVPVVDRVGDVIDEWLAVRLARLAWDDESVAKGQSALLAVVLADAHPEQIGIEVARAAIVRHAVGDMVDRNDFEALVRGC